MFALIRRDFFWHAAKCAKCRWTAAVIAGERPPPDVGGLDEICLRSWRYTLPAMGIDVASPLPVWAKEVGASPLAPPASA